MLIGLTGRRWRGKRENNILKTVPPDHDAAAAGGGWVGFPCMRKKNSTNLNPSEWGGIIKKFDGDRDRMLKWLYSNLKPFEGVEIKAGKLSKFLHRYTK